MTRRGSEEAEVALSTIWFIAECRYRNALASHEAGQDWAAPEDTIQLYQDLRHKAFRYWLTWSLNRELTRQGETLCRRRSSIVSWRDSKNSGARWEGTLWNLTHDPSDR
jgi:hypothetical protein